MTKPPARAPRTEDGFSLIEVIVAVVITTMILGALAAVFVTSSRSTSATSHRSNQSNDAQVISAFLVRDAQAAGSMDPQVGSLDASVGVFTNNPSSCSGTGTVRLRFRWINPSGTGNYVDTVYRLSGNQLTRTLCTTPLAGGSTTTADSVLARTISAASATCTTDTSTGACNDGSNGQPQLPDSVHLAISATNNANPAGAAIVGTYSYTLSANLRPSPIANDGGGGGDPVTAALITLGGSCPPLAINVDNNATLKVYGDALVNQPLNCVETGNNSTFLTHTLTTDSGITDPFASLQPPSSAGMTARSGCPGGVAQPGFYAATLTLGNGASCTFQTGIYRFEHGISYGNNVILTTAAGGALLYFPNEPLSGGNNSNINLSALATGEYAGLALWENASGTIDLGNGGSLIIKGTLYAPNAIVHFSQTSGAPTITSVIALGVDFEENGVGNFGPAPKALAVGATVPSAWTFGEPFDPPIDATGSGGFGTHIFGFGSGSLSGLSIDPSTGLVSGAPSQTGNRTIVLTLDDSFGDPQALVNYPIVINAGMNITTSNTLPGALHGTAYNGPAMARTGGTGPTYTWSATGLPDGLSINSSNGVISGTPTVTGTFSIPVTVTDSVGATRTENFSLTISPVITSVVLANKAGGVAGHVEQGDTITVVFSQTMKVSSFCSLWSNDANDQQLNADGVVTVTIDNSGGAGSNDEIEVAATGCTGGFKFGSLDLGNSGYSTNDATFRRQSAGQINSTIQWTASTRTLVITLGTKTAGNTGTVVSSAPSYAASSSIQDTTNTPLGGLPFNLAAGQQF